MDEREIPGVQADDDNPLQQESGKEQKEGLEIHEEGSIAGNREGLHHIWMYIMSQYHLVSVVYDFLILASPKYAGNWKDVL